MAKSTLRELEDVGARRVPVKKRLSLSKVVESFLKHSMKAPDEIEEKPQYRQRECEAEMRGFYKAQELLREIIALEGTNAIARFADVRKKGQQRPTMMGKLRVWMG